MIRMGRSSGQDENSKDTSALEEQSSTTAFPNAGAGHTSSHRAVTESESMARDIKEGRLSGFVGAGTVLTGDTNFQSLMRVDGHMTGRVSSGEGTLIIGATGQVDADVEVSSAIVNGIINGDITATEKIELGRTARVVGNIKAPRLLMEDGAIIEGNCSMVQAKETFESKHEEQRRQFTTSDLAPVEEDEEDFEETEEDREELLLTAEGIDETLDDETIEVDDKTVAELDDDKTADAATI